MNDTDISNFVFFFFIFVIFSCLIKSCYSKVTNNSNENLAPINSNVILDNQIPPKYEEIEFQPPPPSY